MKVVIIGGGASGIMHAIYLRKLSKNVEIVILEKNERILKKLMKTGNGRCNISNLDMDPKYYNNYEFIKNIYEKLPPVKVLEEIKNMGLLLKTDSSSRLYPYSESAKTVIDTFRYELDKGNIEVLCNQEVTEISKKDYFFIKTKTDNFTADVVVLSSGSIAQEETIGYDLAKAFGHKITSLKPGLVALKVAEDIKSLQGLRVKCRASVINDGQVTYYEDGELLFKDKGISGVLVLNLSRYVKEGSKVKIDLFNDYPDIYNYIMSFLKEKSILDILTSLLPKMLAMYIVKVSENILEKIMETIRNLEFTITGNYGFNQGQIVLGGVAIDNINMDFSSKLVPNLIIIGEVLDIDGASGGYNLHFAWTSGILSALGVFEKNL
jgi:predicted Rossmann fold flavoprotein